MFNPKLFNAGVVAVSVLIGVAIPSVSHAAPSNDDQATRLDMRTSTDLGSCEARPFGRTGPTGKD